LIKEDGEDVSDAKERLEAMKRTRTAREGQVTKLQQKLDVVLSRSFEVCVSAEFEDSV